MLINAYSTRGSVLPMPTAHPDASVRGLDDPELGPHLHGFVNYVLGHGDGQMTAQRYHLMRHVQRVRQHYTFEYMDEDSSALQAWLEQTNAVCFLRDGSVRNPAGRILLGDGADPADDVPYPEDAQQRRAHSQIALAARQIRVPASLPPVPGLDEADPRSAAEVLARCQAVLACALRAETLQTGDTPMTLADLAPRLPALPAALSPQERAFFDSDDSASAAAFGWRYEGLRLLLWALDLDEAPGFPDRICEVPQVVQRLLGHLDAGAPLPALRPTGELLDALDLHYRLHWAVREARQQGSAPPAGLEPGVVYERHYALNWLFRFEHADWDEVDTPT